MATNVKHNVRNISPGIRGLNALTGYVELAAGETRPNVEMSQAEFENAKRTNYFEFDGPAAATGSGNQAEAEALPGTHKALDKIASDEKITFAAETTTVAEKQAAILAARAAKAGGADSGTGNGQPDELDRMSDDDLRVTAAAIAGKSVDEVKDLDRPALLELARATPAGT
jgi:hypothetical protein